MSAGDTGNGGKRMAQSYTSQYEKMTQMPVSKLILQLGIPTTLSMLVTNLYNMADTYFVSALGNSASGAIGVVFSLMAILQAVGFMLGHGAGSNISRQLGARKIERGCLPPPVFLWRYFPDWRLWRAVCFFCAPL